MSSKTRDIIGKVLMGVGILLVILPPILSFAGIETGKMGQILQILGAVKAALGGLLQEQLGG